MSDDRGSSWVGPFVLGFLLGVLLCAGAGGTILMQRQRLLRMELEAAEADAMMAREKSEREVQQLLEQARRLREEADAVERLPPPAEEEPAPPKKGL